LSKAGDALALTLAPKGTKIIEQMAKAKNQGK